MDLPYHGRLYIEWSQSERVKLTVVEPDGTMAETFLLPRDLLRRRSRKFRDTLGMYVSGMPIPDTPVETMQDFYIWTLSPQPHVDEHCSFDKVVRLGIFAYRYEISALNNQITDMIRANLASGEWQLQASTVDDIYGTTPAGSPLREVVRAALGQLPRSMNELEGDAKEEWRATVLKHAELGWDYIEAGGSEWTRSAYLAGVCRFHDHEGVPYQNGMLASCDGCPYAQDECYPRWEEQDQPQQPQGEEEMDSLKDEVDETEPAQEINGLMDHLSIDKEPPIYEVHESTAMEPIEEEPAEEATTVAQEPEPVPEEAPVSAYRYAEDAVPINESLYPEEPPSLTEVPAPPSAEVSYESLSPEPEPQLEPMGGWGDRTPHAEDPATESPPVEEEAAPSETNGVAETVVSDSAHEDGDGAPPRATMHLNGTTPAQEKGMPTAGDANATTHGAEVETSKSKKKKNKKKKAGESAH